ncbi:hypothetical protein AB1Y20_004721 [Prymnesium parvum]|uniref:Protein-tyrosine sulfotransferase n=1 Tax=Prymnesium parvum TaxID=97485 RepID=A0AB34J125_PRYPA
MHAAVLACAASTQPLALPLTWHAPLEPVPPVLGAWNASILVGTHHKTGTVLLAKVFRLASKLIGVPRSKANKTSTAGACAQLFESHAAGVCIEEHTSVLTLRHWLSPGAPFIHVVRDPLEMCVSAYLYHLHGAEPWLLLPHAELRGKTLQQFYRDASQADGVRFECTRMMSELVDEALVRNATARRGALTLYFEDFTPDFDGTMRRIFEYLDSREKVGQLVTLASEYDLTRHSAHDERHVSAADAKQPLRDILFSDPLLREVITGLRVLLGYSNETAPQRSVLCENLRKLCATTHVGFITWCPNGRVLLGKLQSFPECGEANVRGASHQVVLTNYTKPIT